MLVRFLEHKSLGRRDWNAMIKESKIESQLFCRKLNVKMASVMNGERIGSINKFYRWLDRINQCGRNSSLLMIMTRYSEKQLQNRNDPFDPWKQCNRLERRKAERCYGQTVQLLPESRGHFFLLNKDVTTQRILLSLGRAGEVHELSNNSAMPIYDAIV